MPAIAAQSGDGSKACGPAEQLFWPMAAYRHRENTSHSWDYGSDDGCNGRSARFSSLTREPVGCSRSRPDGRVIAYAAENPPALPLTAVPTAKLLRRIKKVPFAGRHLHDDREVISGQLLSPDVNPAKTLILQELQKV